METEICLQLKCSVSLPVVIDCQKDSGTTVENGTQVKPVLLTAIRFAVYLKIGRQEFSRVFYPLVDESSVFGKREFYPKG